MRDDDADRVGACLKECRDMQKDCQIEFTGGDLCDQNHRRCAIACHGAEEGLMADDDSDDDYLPDYDYDKDAACVTSCEAVLANCINDGSPIENCRMDHLECTDGCDRSTVAGC